MTPPETFSDLATRVPAEATDLIARYANGNQSAADRLMPLFYEELKRVARNQLRNERRDHTLQGTGLVNEAFLRLSERTQLPWHDRVHFFRLASQVMRHILVDHARAKQALKRGGDVSVTSLDQTAIDYHAQCANQLFSQEEAEGAVETELDFIALDEALAKLRALSARQAQVVDLRFFGNLTLEETAEVIGISLATAKRDWTMARLFLKRELAHRERLAP
ncbi:MAG: sigma-70 family RNA polymerase sigma factor [Betaproteobacteria bacterium]|nr:MAG: sigma-70 family RNA polymerase sigma factor [Betaproteobacteria bacterium]